MKDPIPPGKLRGQLRVSVNKDPDNIPVLTFDLAAV